MSRIVTIQGRGIMPGRVEGPALIGESLQGNAALDYRTGEIIQKGHSLRGRRLKDAILIIAGARGSTGWSVRLHTCLVNGVGPAGMVFPRMDARTAGAVAAMKIPAVTDLDGDVFALVDLDDWVRVDGDHGRVVVHKGDMEP